MHILLPSPPLITWLYFMCQVLLTTFREDAHESGGEMIILLGGTQEVNSMHRRCSSLLLVAADHHFGFLTMPHSIM